MLLLSTIIATMAIDNTSGQAIDIEFNIPSEPKQAGIIRGFWHNLSIPDTSSSLTVKLTRDATIQNETNNYLWSFTNGEWKDELYLNAYIDSANCQRTDTFTRFRIGVDVTADIDTWQIEITGDSGVIHSGTINILTPVRNLSLFTPDYFFIAEENSTEWVPPVSNQYFRLKNTGSVPLAVPTFSFSDKNGTVRDNNFKLTNTTQMLPAGAESKHFMSFRVDDTLPAQSFMLVTCLVKSKALYVIPATNSHVLEGIFAHQFTVSTYVKHTGDSFVDANPYLIYEYKKSMNIYPEENIRHEVFITALKDTPVTIGVTSTNVEISQVAYSGSIQTTPFTFTLNTSQTCTISLDAIAHEENTTGKIVYGITPAGSATEFLQVDLDIGFKQPPVERIWIIGIAIGIVALMIIVGTISMINKKRRIQELKNSKLKKEGKKWKRNT